MSQLELPEEPRSKDISWREVIQFGFDEFSDEDIDSSYSLFAYQGFDPSYIRRTALDLGDMKEITQLLILSLRQGTNDDKFKSSFTTEGSQLYSALKSKFHIVKYDGSSQKIARKTMTIQRLQSAFPELVSAILIRLHKSKSFKTVGASELDMNTYGYLMFPSAPSIIPHDRDDLMKVWRNWNSKFSKIINRKRKDYDEETQENFVQVIHDSPLFSDKERAKIIDELEEKFNE